MIKKEKIKNAEEQKEPPVDIDYLNMLTDGDLEDEQELMNLFFKQIDLSLNALEECGTDEQEEIWKETVHKIKGASANLGASDLFIACEQAEADYEANKNSNKNLLIDIKMRLEDIRSYFESRGSI